MTGSLRYLLALAFVAAFFLVPDADDGQLAFLSTRAWLIGDGGPLAENLPDDAPVPPLIVDYIESGAGDATRLERSRQFARASREWARAQCRDFDPALPPMQLAVRVGDNGFRSTLYDSRGQELAMRQTLREPKDGAPSVGYYPDRWSLLPAFLAIVLAILSGHIVPSLLLGCLAGALLFAGGPIAAADHLFLGTIWARILTSRFQLEIMAFVMLLFMTVGVMARSGGIQGMVEWVRRWARGPVSTQLVSFVIGVLIFFDDYSNCIITGTTMRPLADRNRVAREKLAYVVDSTAAPIAGISIFSTWVAYEVSMFAPQLPEVTKTDGVTPYTQGDGFAVFVQTLPFRFYCIFTLLMVLATILLRREYGPMLGAARRAWHQRKPLADDAQPMVAEGLSKTAPPDHVPPRGINALLPILLLVGVTVGMVFYFGSQGLSAADYELPLWQRITRILGHGESQRALMLASASALTLAMLMAIGHRVIGLGDRLPAATIDIFRSAANSARSLVFALVILVLAWTIGQICKDLGTAQFLTAAFLGTFSPWLLPVVMFLLASLVSFSTGTSYGTMAILLPNVVVLAHTMGVAIPDLGGPTLMVLTIGAVLEGSIFGDHCSPISDTTVLSSVATGSDHLHHVRTQAPYALTIMAISVCCGYVPAALLGPEWWPLCWALCALAVVAVLLLIGRDPQRKAAG